MKLSDTDKINGSILNLAGFVCLFVYFLLSFFFFFFGGGGWGWALYFSSS